ncbi:MAG: mechanosensitive ion channel [Anaerolineae bacterium]|nr:mechanosensitive ion channel [Anaerolineae bacterium]
MDYNFFNAPIQKLLEEVLIFIPKLVVAIVIFLVMLYVANLAAKAVKNATQKRRFDAELSMLFCRLTRWSLIILGTIWALQQVSFNVTGFVAGLGIAGFTIGFALKDIAENFVAGILLLLQQPFDIGESIEVAGYSGTVTDIQIRATTIHTWDGLLVLVPNASVYTSAITNYSKVDKRRIGLDIGVGYETDLQKAHDTMLKVVSDLPGVIKDDPEPTVIFKEFADSAINASLYFWVDLHQADYFPTLDAAVKAIKVAFEKEGINIPYPIRTVYVNQVAR